MQWGVISFTLTMKQKNVAIAAVAAIVILGLIGYMVAGNKSTTSKPKQMKAVVEAIPTVDSSVKVDFKRAAGNNVILTIDSLPSETTSLDYTFSYDTKAQGSQGIIGEGIKIEADQKKYTLTRFLGTQSSGNSVYHEVLGPVKLEIKFTGSYGEKIFVKEYEI